MYTCCRNVVLRRMYLLFEEFLPAFGLEKKVRHDINSLGKAAAAKAKSVVAKAVAASHPEPVQYIDTIVFVNNEAEFNLWWIYAFSPNLHFQNPVLRKTGGQE